MATFCCSKLTCILRPCFDRSIKESDSPLQVKRKKILIAVAIVAVSSALFGLQHNIGKKIIMTIGLLIYIAISIVVLLALIVLQWDATDTMMEAFCCWCSVVIALQQYHSSILQLTPNWPLFVLVVDILLVCEAPMRTTVGVVCWCCIFLCILSAESTFRFGIFDLEYQHYAQSYRREQFDCEKLPCAKPLTNSIAEFLTQGIVFLLDFICTRGFAAAVLEEKNNILASVDAANAIATSLSRFDLEQATSLLEDADIPEGLRDALEQILCNLRSYRPYLPQSCIPACYSSGSAEESVRSGPCEENSYHSSSRSSSHISNKSGLPNNVRKKFECVSASLLVANIRNSFAVLQYSQDSFNGLISDMISATSDVIVKHRGTLDLFLGDRVFANFGAARSHVNHPTSCTDAAMAITLLADRVLGRYQKFASNNLSINIGMASGKLVCGDLGSESILRFSVIGKLSLLVSVVERVASIKGVPMLTEVGLYHLLKYTAEIRVHLQTVLHDDTEHVLYELIPKKNIEETEWMYQLQQSGCGKWDAFNEVAIALLTGKSRPDLDKLEKQAWTSHHDELREFLSSGCPDPLTITKR